MGSDTKTGWEGKRRWWNEIIKAEDPEIDVVYAGIYSQCKYSPDDSRPITDWWMCLRVRERDDVRVIAFHCERDARLLLTLPVYSHKMAPSRRLLLRSELSLSRSNCPSLSRQKWPGIEVVNWDWGGGGNAFRALRLFPQRWRFQELRKDVGHDFASDGGLRLRTKSWGRCTLCEIDGCLLNNFSTESVANGSSQTSDNNKFMLS